MTPFEKAMMNMTPAQRKKANAGLSEMMGMPPKKKGYINFTVFREKSQTLFS